MSAPHAPRASAVYGPVRSWRMGTSLGIDLLLRSSVCSFRCTYCQLGRIETPTGDRRTWVPTDQVLADLARLPAEALARVDVVTFSGSGEPTLAANLGEAIAAVKAATGKPVAVLTNAVHLGDADVRAELALADRVFLKLDAADDATLRRVNRPVPGVTVAGIVAGMLAFRAQYTGHLAVQAMFLPMNLPARGLPDRPGPEVVRFARLLRAVDPDEIQLNTPLRPVPRRWVLEARGDVAEAPDEVETVALRPVSPTQARWLEAQLATLTGLPVTSVYDHTGADALPA